MVEMVLGIMIGCVVAALGFAAVHALFEDGKKNGLVKGNYEDGEEQKKNARCRRIERLAIRESNT